MGRKNGSTVKTQVEVILVRLEGICKKLDELSDTMQLHDKISQLFRDKTLGCEADIKWMKKIGAGVFGGGGLAGLVWGFMKIFIN